MTLTEYIRQQLKNPGFKREYDALEDWYQEELERQKALSKEDATLSSPAIGAQDKIRPAFA